MHSKEKIIVIIGFGFSGTLCAAHLIQESTHPIEIILIDGSSNHCRGIAYSTYSDRHLLNVTASKMSAFEDEPEHFTSWLKKKQLYSKEISVDKIFAPRNFYGKYLEEIWETAKTLAVKKNIKIQVLKNYAQNIKFNNDEVEIYLDDGEVMNGTHCILATGNDIPGNLDIPDKKVFLSKNYFQNPWNEKAVKNVNMNLPVLIIGNGLTMTDTVIGLLENNFEGEIISISSNGFNIFPHIQYSVNYQELIKDWISIKDKNLYRLVVLFNHHRKLLKKNNLGPEPLIDSLRTHTQTIWRILSVEEKKIFISRLRHLWGVARHRIPMETFDFIKSLQHKNKLKILAGKILTISESKNVFTVEFYDKRSLQKTELKVSRIINCTGPQTDLSLSKNRLLSTLYKNKYIEQDKIKLGIKTNLENFKVVNVKGMEYANFYTLGSNLKGELWESTAVNEIRIQAKKLACIILKDQEMC